MQARLLPVMLTVVFFGEGRALPAANLCESNQSARQQAVAAIAANSEAYQSIIGAGDVQKFFGAGFQSASDEQKKKCVADLLMAMGSLENACKGGGCSPEPGGMADSCGFLQLSYGECAREGGNVEDQETNIRCGVRIMGERIKQFGGCIATCEGREGDARTKGASQYWSVLRTPYRAAGVSAQLGKQAEIIELTSKCLNTN